MNTHVQSLAGHVALTAAAAGELVAAVDVLEQLAHDRGQRLTPTMQAIRAGLAAATGAGTGAHARTQELHSIPVHTAPREPGTVDTTTAATELGITPSGVRDLVRRGRLPAVRRAGRWWIDPNDIAALSDSRTR